MAADNNRPVARRASAVSSRDGNDTACSKGELRSNASEFFEAQSDV